MTVYIQPCTFKQQTMPKKFFKSSSDERGEINKQAHTRPQAQKISWPVWSWSIEVTSLSKTVLLIILPVLKLNTWNTKNIHNTFERGDNTNTLYIFFYMKLTARPTVPRPKTATMEPGSTLAVFQTAPRPKMIVNI